MLFISTFVKISHLIQRFRWGDTGVAVYAQMHVPTQTHMQANTYTHTHTLKSLFLHVTWSVLSIRNKWHKIQTRNIKHKYHHSNVEAWKVVAAAITTLSPIIVVLLLKNPPLFLCMEPHILKTLCISSSYICHGVGPLVDPFRSHVSRSLYKGLQ
jgi:hypothetical protein